MCYGRNLATMGMVDLGEAVGILAAQSIGEPGTQLTLRTFHIGGTAARIAEQTYRKTKLEGKIGYGERLQFVETEDGKRIVTGYEGELVLYDEEDQIRSRFQVPLGATLNISDGDVVKRGDMMFAWDPYTNPIITDVGGTVRFVDIVEDETVREELDEITGLRQRVIIEDRDKKLHPHIEIVQTIKGGKQRRVRNYVVPEGAQLTVEDGKEISPGQTLSKISREAYKTRDITGGLPRVAELFEARRPRDAATVTEIDGAVQFRGTTRGMRKVVVVGDTGVEKEYLIPHGRHVRTYDGERVLAGDRLTEGPINPMDILSIKGVGAVQSYLVNAIQEVYRLQGVRINDKHIEIIVSRMLQKVQILTPGDTPFLEGDQAPKKGVEESNRMVQAKNLRLREKGEPELEPATFEPLLLGITKASLTTDSFISAASFQETTRVLTDAATRSKRDELHSLKENVIMGHLISAGTGLARYKNLSVEDPEDEDESILDAVEQMRLMAEAQEAAGGDLPEIIME